MVRRAATSLAALGLLAVAAAAPARAAVYGLVVGIDDYAHQAPLAGAVNDARLIARTLESIGADEVVMLLNADASRANIEQAWRDLTGRAAPGDTIVFSYAGHGAQEAERVPGNEADGRDEVLVLGRFRTERPGNGERIVDDELNRWFASVPELNVIFVADACHSGTLTRSVDPRAGPERTRTIGDYGGIDEALDELPRPVEPAPAETELPNLVFFSAAQDDQKIAELTIDGRPHGALSWVFARAIRGAADLDGDGVLAKGELESYVVENVRMLAEGRQQPHVLPAGGAQRALLEAPRRPAPAAAAPAELEPLAVHLLGVGATEAERRLAALTGVVAAGSQAGAQLVFDLAAREALNGHGDVVAGLGAADTQALQAIVDKLRLVGAVQRLSESRSLRLRIEPGDRLFHEGDRLAVVIDGHDEPHLTLFNVAADGTIQYLYPLARDESTVARDRPFRLDIEAAPPFGADHLVAITHASAPAALRARLKSLDGRRAAADVAAALAAGLGGAYRMAVIGVYTAE